MELLAVCLEQMRKRLSWRKWWRSCGLAYVKPVDPQMENEWIELNGLASALSNRYSTTLQKYQLNYMLNAWFLCDLNQEQLRDANIIRRRLLDHYEWYCGTSDEIKFLFQYVESLRDFLPVTTVDHTPLVNELIAQYRTAYFRSTYSIDHTTKRINDSTLWYYLRCIHCSKNVFLSSSLELDNKQRRGYDDELTYIINGSNAFRVCDENWTCLAWQLSSTSSQAPPRTTVSRCDANDIESWVKFLRVTTMLNVPPATCDRDTELIAATTTANNTLSNDIDVAFRVTQKFIDQISQPERRSTARLLPPLERPIACSVNKSIDHLTLSMINVVQIFGWWLHWQARKKDEQSKNLAGFVRLAPTANAIQLAARKYKQLNEQQQQHYGGLAFDDQVAIFQHHESNDDTDTVPITVYATNVILDTFSMTNDTTRHGRSFYMLHEQHPKLVSVFVRPDQDPSVTRVLDLFNESECERGAGTNNRYLRWVIGIIDEKKPALEFMSSAIYLPLPNQNSIDFSSFPLLINLVMLLRDIHRELQPAHFFIDSYMSQGVKGYADNDSNECAVALAATAAGPRTRETKQSRVTATPPQLPYIYSSQIITNADDLYELCNRVASKGYVLKAKPKNNFYAPADSFLYRHSWAGFVPWSINRSDLFDWKCFTVNPTEQLTVVHTDEVQLIVQEHRRRWYQLTDRNEIRRFLDSGRGLGLPHKIPIVRVLPKPPFKLYKLVAKRIYTMENGIVFVTASPLKFMQHTERGCLSNARMLDENTVCPFNRWQRVGCFYKADLFGSEIWIPFKIDSRREKRCYRNVPKQVIPLIAWLDRKL